MRTHQLWLKRITKLGLIFMIGASMSADAGLFGFGGTSWKEEVLLHDGSKIIVERNVERGRGHEIGQQPPIKNQNLSFTLPGTNEKVTWDDHYSEDIGSASFLPILLDIHRSAAYLVADTMGCLSYNKWGRPNPPYVIFKYSNKVWQRITVQGLPTEIKTPNLIFSMPDLEVEKLGKDFVSAEMVQTIINGYRYKQTEHIAIIRETMKKAELGSSLSCPELERYKGGWRTPGGPKLAYPITPPDTKPATNTQTKP